MDYISASDRQTVTVRSTTYTHRHDIQSKTSLFLYIVTASSTSVYPFPLLLDHDNFGTCPSSFQQIQHARSEPKSAEFVWKGETSEPNFFPTLDMQVVYPCSGRCPSDVDGAMESGPTCRNLEVRLSVDPADFGGEGCKARHVIMSRRVVSSRKASVRRQT